MPRVCSTRPRARRFALALLLVAVGLGCGGETTGPPLDRLTRPLTRACVATPVGFEVQPPSVAQAPNQLMGSRDILVEIGADAVWVDGEKLGTDEGAALFEAVELAAAPIESKAQIEAQDRGAEVEGPRVWLVADADAPAARVAELGYMSARAVSDQRLVFASEVGTSVVMPDPDYHAELEERFAGVAGPERDQALSAEAKSLTEACPGARRAFTDVAQAEEAARCPALLSALIVELPRCPKGFDRDRFDTLVLFLLGLSPGEQRWAVTVTPPEQLLLRDSEIPEATSWAEWAAENI